eukprot:TRINITY_DN30364_c0_g2_i1.p1 TRINITY_DN30364_c0_g2~~TRINITY_DN30364_c0_g2_i1.p1  ORF type:complete len:1037 (-),score=158.51 TRINITY_DN30364_c0_g2_i1:328-3375(-)
MPDAITYDTFKEWTSTCGVRNLQKPYEQLVADAKENERSVLEEMRIQGYKDAHAFSKSCPRFRMLCWPREFGELGSGYVLYFHFLSFLATILFVLFLVQVPAMVQYGGQNWITGWQNRGSWSDSYNLGSEPCKCIEKNDGIKSLRLGDGNDQTFGTRCKAWDLPACQEGSSSVKELGKWCCSRWCFAAPTCPTPLLEDDGDKVFLSNRFYKGLVKSYSACEQEETLLACSSGMMARPTPFSEPGVDEGKSSGFIGTGWLTPGNFGPNMAEGTTIPLIYVVAIILICLIVCFAYCHQYVADRQVDGDTVLPNDFAMLVRGLPTTATDEVALKRFFQENSVRGCTTTEIVKVIIGWDAAEFRERIREIKQLRSQLGKLEADDPAAAEIKASIGAITKELASCAPESASRLRSSGLVVVVFRFPQDLRATLSRWNGFWGRFFYCDGEDSSFLWSRNNIWKGASLPRFPVGDPPVPIHQIKVERAANPGDIHWEELGVDAWERRKMFLKTNLAMAGLIIVSFLLIWGLNTIQAQLESENGYLSLLPALGVAVLNASLTFAAMTLGDREYYETWTEQEFSQSLKMSIAMIANTGFVLFFCEMRPHNWYETGGLVDDVFVMLLINSLAQPLMGFLDIPYMCKCNRRRKVTDAKLAEWNAAIGSGDASALKTLTAEIETYKAGFVPSQMKNQRRYANALKTFVCCLIYAPLVPLVCIVGVVGLALQYWVDKYMLLNWYMRPPRPANCEMCMQSTRFVKIVAPIGLSLAFFLFLTPSWKDKAVVLQFFLFALLISVGFQCVPLRVLRRALCCSFRSGDFQAVDDLGEDYYKAQYLWSKQMKYHKDHFLYKCLPEAKNPEYLSPDSDTAVGIDDMKDSYGDAAQSAADTAATGSGGTLILAHGKVMTSSSSSLGSKPMDTVVPTTTYGAPGVAPPAGSAASHAGSKVEPAAGIWEFETKRGFEAFADDCQAFLEDRFQNYKSGSGKSRINCNTSGKTVSIDFERMSSKVADSHKIRAIRRVESG